MARERNPSGPILQRAYGVLDKYQITRTFFVKTDQTNCVTEAEPEEADENNNPGFDIVVDDEEVLNEYYNGVPAQNGYYRQNAPKDDKVAAEQKLPAVEVQKETSTNASDAKPAAPQKSEEKESKKTAPASSLSSA